ncbi:MAG TPA: hypothetical protein VM915_09655, partial [Verrucomicrobiae bacterium]|nr:hypothetical protein [Verrucomicrobiae bacterium]
MRFSLLACSSVALMAFAGVAFGQVRLPAPVIREAPNISDPAVPVFYVHTGIERNFNIPGRDDGSGSGAPSPQDADGDFDGDSHVSRSRGGDDCDDNDMNNYPRSGAEVADLVGHDEDCNPYT